jgi:hypothetical protein
MSFFEKIMNLGKPIGWESLRALDNAPPRSHVLVSLGEKGRSSYLAEEIYEGKFLVLYDREDDPHGPPGARFGGLSQIGLFFDDCDGMQRLPFFIDDDGVQSYRRNELHPGTGLSLKAWRISGPETVALILMVPAASLFVASDYYRNKSEEKYHLNDDDRQELRRIIQENS